jgi:hypothetical protein
MRWKDADRTKLAVASKAMVPIERLKQEVDQAKGAGARCMQIGNKMEAYFLPDDELEIKEYAPGTQDVQLGSSTVWTWRIVASETGHHLMNLNVTAHVWAESEGARFRSVTQNPPLFDDDIYVSATRREVFMDFVTHRWSVLVPICLTILTAIIIPFLLPWWKRRNQPSEPGNGPSGTPRNDRWV